MELRLSLFGVKRSIDLSFLARFRNTWVVLAASVLVMPLTLWLLAPVLTPFLIGAILAYALHPAVERLAARRVPWRQRDLLPIAVLGIVQFGVVVALLNYALQTIGRINPMAPRMAQGGKLPAKPAAKPTARN